MTEIFLGVGFIAFTFYREWRFSLERIEAEKERTALFCRFDDERQKLNREAEVEREKLRQDAKDERNKLLDKTDDERKATMDAAKEERAELLDRIQAPSFMELKAEDYPKEQMEPQFGHGDDADIEKWRKDKQKNENELESEFGTMESMAGFQPL